MSDRLRLFSLLGTVSLVVAVAFVLGRWSVSEGDEAVVAARGLVREIYYIEDLPKPEIEPIVLEPASAAVQPAIHSEDSD